MKKLVLFAIISMHALATTYSQSCLPDGIIFYSQADIDNFQTNYPDCIEIEGDVSIGNGYPSDITNLNGLNVVTAIGGNLDINSHESLSNLSGLEALASIGGYLLIEENESLSGLEGLDGLTMIGGDLLFYENHNLTDFSGLDALTGIGGYLKIGYHTALASLTGLEAVTHWGY